MPQRTKRIPHNLFFLVLAMFYLWLVVEPRLIYQCFGSVLPDAPIFLTGWSFLGNCLRLPGGPVTYVSGLLSQGFYYSWLGALIIVSLALCLCELFRRHLVAAGSWGATVLSSVPAIVAILLYSQYKHPLPACLAVSLGLACSLAFEKLPWRTSAIRAPAYCLFAAVLFWLAGAGGLLIFAAMTAIHGALIRRDFVLALLALPAGFGIIWCLAQYAFIVPPRQAFSVLTPFSPEVPEGINPLSSALIFILYGFAPLGVILLMLGGKVFGRIGQRQKRRSKRTRGRKARAAHGKTSRFPVILIKTVAAAMPILVTGAALYFSHDRMSKPLVQAHDYHLRQQWREILELSNSLPKGRSNVYFNHSVNRALYHTGRLPYDMFKFPQTPHGIFLTHEAKASYLTQLILCDLFMELGRVNSAERLASEILAAKNHSGIVVEKIAWINILKGQHDTARIYLNVLKRDPVYRGRAEALLSSLDGGFAPDESTYIETIRPRMHRADHRGAWDESIEQILLELLASNPANRMAFEYLMACYLITGRPDKVAASMGQLREFGYNGVPTLYEEAILVYLGSKGQKIDLSRFNIKRETIDRYVEFVKLRNSLRPENRQIVLNRLITRFGSSYFFYSTFGRVGLM